MLRWTVCQKQRFGTKWWASWRMPSRRKVRNCTIRADLMHRCPSTYIPALNKDLLWVNGNEYLMLASVWKVLTSHWALRQHGFTKFVSHQHADSFVQASFDYADACPAHRIFSGPLELANLHLTEKLESDQSCTQEYLHMQNCLTSVLYVYT